MNEKNMAKNNEFESSKGRPLTCRYCDTQYHVKDRAKWEIEKHPCPSCSEIWSDKPETERMLMILQDEYLEKRNLKKDHLADKAFKQMISIMQSYCASIIKRYFSNKIQEPGNLERYVQWSVSKIVEEYLKIPDFKIWGSFKGDLVRKCQEAIWGKQEKTCAQETLDFEFDDGSTVIYADEKKSYADYLHEKHVKEQLVDKLCELIFGVSEYCTEEEDFIRILNIRNYIIAGEKWPDLFFNYYGRLAKDKYLDTLTVSKQELESLSEDKNSIFNEIVEQQKQKEISENISKREILEKQINKKIKACDIKDLVDNDFYDIIASLIEEIKEIKLSIDGCTLLTYATKNKKYKFIEFFLKNNFDPNIKDSNGDYPITLAVQTKRLPFVQLYKDYSDKRKEKTEKVNIDIKDKNGISAREYAYQLCDSKMIELFEDWSKIIKHFN